MAELTLRVRRCRERTSTRAPPNGAASFRRTDNTSSRSLQRAAARPTGSPSQSSENGTIVFENFGRAVLYTLAELEAWDRKNLVICRSSKILSGNELGQRNDHESSSKPPIGSWVI